MREKMRELEIANSELVGKAEGYDCIIENVNIP